MRKVGRLLLILAAAAAWPAAAQTWDNSGNGMLSGTYYFREVFYIVGDNAGDLQRALALYNQVTFDGNGHYSMNAVLADSGAGSLQSGTITGTYSISPSGYGFLSNPLSNGDYIFGLVSQSGVFIGSSTEAGFNDLFIAAPLSSSPSTSIFKGSYTVALADLSGALYYGVGYALDAMFQLNPDGAGNLGNVGFTGYAGLGGSSPYTQAAAAVKYVYSNGAWSIAFPTSSNAILVSGQKYVYSSPDGNFIFGGSPSGFDMFVGVKTGSTTPSFGGLYYQAGIDEDESNLGSGGYGLLDTYFGSLSANNGNVVGHQRQSDVFFSSATGYTYADSYSLKSDGTYTSGVTRYAVGAGGTIRIGSGIGPFLGINVALAAPSPSGSGVYINPQGVVNAASFAPFTAGISPGGLITIYGTNLAGGTQFASSIPFPTNLGNTQVTVNGQNAPIYYVTPGQISVIVPYAVSPTATNTIANIQVNNNGTLSNTVSTFINATTPGIFTIPPGGINYGAVLHADFSLVTAQSPAKIGETISVYLTGLGAVSPAIQDGAAGPVDTLSKTSNTITADISGISATVSYAGLAPQLAGLYQVNLTIPTGVTAGDNTLDIAGPDSYAVEALIPIATSSTANAVPATPKPMTAKAVKGTSRKIERNAHILRPWPF
jgi:uncharacterized protein (TIGR03437 family)